MTQNGKTKDKIEKNMYKMGSLFDQLAFFKSKLPKQLLIPNSRHFVDRKMILEFEIWSVFSPTVLSAECYSQQQPTGNAGTVGGEVTAKDFAALVKRPHEAVGVDQEMYHIM